MPLAAHIRYRVDPRDVPPEKAARRMGLTLAAFELNQEALYARGFPHPDPTTGMYDLVAIDAWMDARSNLTHTPDLTDAKPARNAQEVFGDRARRILHGQR